MRSRHSFSLLALATTALLAGCDSQQVTTKVEQLQTAAQAAWARMGPSDCGQDAVATAIRQESGFYYDDPVRGLQPLEGVTVSLEKLQLDESQEDRWVCTGEMVIAGPRSTLLKQVLALNWAEDSAFALEEISTGYNPDGEQEPGLWGMLGSITAVSVLALTQALEGGPDGNALIEMRSDIEYAVLKNPPPGQALKAWAWVRGDSPGYHAGALLRPQPNPTVAPGRS